MAGHNYAVYIGGAVEVVSGTSASAPVFAAVITLITDQRLLSGKAPLGFLNPALYALHARAPAAFNDITKGNNRCAAGAPQGQEGAATCCPNGFTAGKGWDPVSGLGRWVKAIVEDPVDRTQPVLTPSPPPPPAPRFFLFPSVNFPQLSAALLALP